MRKIALLTSGGDAPGMNACIRAITKTALHKGIECFGFEDGYQGMIEKRGKLLTYEDVDNIIQTSGTILGSARCSDFLTINGRLQAITGMKEMGIDGLIVIGGDGTFAGAERICAESNIPVLGIPATIDNDIPDSDYSIGFETAVQTALDAVDNIRNTASSHHRIFFVEVMGRHSGLIALHTAIAAGAKSSVLIPEEITDISLLAKDIRKQNQGKRSCIIIVSEGDDGGDAYHIMKRIAPNLPEFELRHSVLGHIQRGGKPVVKDRIVASRMGFKAVELLCQGLFGHFIGTFRDELVTIPFGNGKVNSTKDNYEFLNLIEVFRTKDDIQSL